MTIWEILPLVGVAWALGPKVLQVAGAALLALAIFSLAATGDTEHGGAFVLLAGGTAMLYVGFQWRAARLSGYPSEPGVRVRRALAKLILRRNPHGAIRRRLAFSVARALGPLQAQGLLRDALSGRKPARPARQRSSPRETPAAESADAEWIDGRASENDRWNGRSGPPSSTTELLREEVDRILEDARDALERIIWALFVSSYPDWRKRLTEQRLRRRPDLPPIPGGAEALHDRRLLFSVIAYDWPLIGHEFKRDPSRAAHRLCEIANRYAHEGPLDNDARDAKQAFAEILAAMRPHAIQTAKGFVRHSRPLARQ
jgi:hypothetical protein